MAEASASTILSAPYDLMVNPGEERRPLLYIDPTTLTRIIWACKVAIVIGFVMTITSLPLLARLSIPPEINEDGRVVGPVFITVGFFLMYVGVWFHRELKSYREYIFTLNTDVGDSNAGAYVRTPEVIRSHGLPPVQRPRVVIPSSPPLPINPAQLPSTPYGPHETNFIEITQPYASFQSMGIPPPPYKP